MDTVLITGVAGLIGSRLASFIISNHPEYQVIGVDNFFGGYIENLPSEGLPFYKMNTEDESLSKIFKKYHPKYVFHLSALACEGLSPFMRKYIHTTNLLATANVINNCINFEATRLVYTSSMSVYGEGIPGQRFDEDLTPAPEDPYAISKYACELDIKSAGVTHGLDWCIIRPHNVYGINQNIWDRYRNVLGIWMYQRLNNEPLTIYGDGKQTRAFSYIDDCLPCFWNAATFEKASKEIINVGGIIPYKIKDACDILLKIIGDHPVIYKEQRFEVTHAIPSYQKSIDYLDYKETISLKEGLADMWAWAQTQPNRPRFKWSQYEVEKGIYSYWK